MEPCRRHGGGGRGRGRRSSRLFECLFCDKTFHKSQALGGHQNAHKKDHRVAGGYWDPYVYGNGGNHPAAAATTAARDPYACWAPTDSGGCPAASTMPPPVAGTPHGLATAGLVFAGHGGGISRDAAGSGWRDNRGWRPMMGCESDDVGASFFVASREDGGDDAVGGGGEEVDLQLRL